MDRPAVTAATSPDEDEARHHVRMLVWPGVSTREQAAEMLDEGLAEGMVEGSVDALTAMLDEEWAAKRAAERDWPAVTDCDRLEQAFQTLGAAGYVCLHDSGFEMSDGLHDVGAVWRSRGGAASGLKGYCFYHRQDVERALDGDGLWLAFGAFDNTPAGATAAAHAVVGALARAGIDATWDGTAGKRIGLESFRWQRRSPA